MASAKDRLWQRGRQYYLKLGIPRKLRQHFPGKKGKPRDTILEPLGNHYDAAKVECARRVGRYLAVFARLNDGKVMTPDQIKTFVALDLNALAEQYKAKMVADAFTSPLTDTSLEKELEMQKRYDNPPPYPLFDILDYDVEQVAKSANPPLPLDAASRNEIRKALELANRKARQEIIAKMAEQRIRAKVAELDALTKLTGDKPPAIPPIIEPAPVVAPVVPTETLNQAAEAWYAEMQRDPSAAVRRETLDGHKAHVRAAVKYFGDVALTDITPAKASDWLANVAKEDDRSNRTINKYAATLAKVYKSARSRGRFTGQNPFEGLRRKVGGQKYAPFTMPELESLFGSFTFEAPKRHSPESALPWASLIALYSGLRLEEIAQLDVADIHPQDGIMVFEIHNGARNHLKNETSERLVPVHSELIRLGLLRYRDSLPKDGLLFPGLKRRTSKGGKIGARIGELFRKRIEALGIKQKAAKDNRRICFHSLRKNAGGAMERGGASESDSGRVLGHALGMTFGTYSQPVLERVQETVERIQYPGLRIEVAK
jgi:integrase